MAPGGSVKLMQMSSLWNGVAANAGEFGDDLALCDVGIVVA